MKKLLHLSPALVLAVMLTACQPADDSSTEDSATETASTDSHAGHHHDHGELGPNGGHLLHLEPSGAHAEWTHDEETSLITVYLGDFDASKVQTAKFVVDVPDSETEEFELQASDSGWTITSEALMTHVNMADVANVSLVVIDDEGEHSTKIEHHEHDHHNH